MLLAGPPTIPASRMLIVLASLSDKIADPIVNVATDFIGTAGVAGVFVLMLLESACIPVPSEAIMLFAGFSVSEGDMTLFGAVAAGVLGNLAGSWIAYGVGYFARLDLLERNRLIHVSPKHLKWADDWFQRYGDATVFFTRMLPIIRTFISLPAGVAKMPFWRFTAFTLAGCVPWVLMLALVGRSVGDNWEQWRHNLGYLDYAVLAAIVVGIVYLLIRRRRGGGETGAGSTDEKPAVKAEATR
jgi:membrane protein DedA with SNARE-associated domain